MRRSLIGGWMVSVCVMRRVTAGGQTNRMGSKIFRSIATRGIIGKSSDWWLLASRLGRLSVMWNTAGWWRWIIQYVTSLTGRFTENYKDWPNTLQSFESRDKFHNTWSKIEIPLLQKGIQAGVAHCILILVYRCVPGVLHFNTVQVIFSETWNTLVRFCWMEGDFCKTVVQQF